MAVEIPRKSPQINVFVDWDPEPIVRKICNTTDHSIDAASAVCKAAIQQTAVTLTPSIPGPAMKAVVDVGCAKVTDSTKKATTCVVETAYSNPDGCVARVTRYVTGK
jgi:hypothetical protein